MQSGQTFSSRLYERSDVGRHGSSLRPGSRHVGAPGATVGHPWLGRYWGGLVTGLRPLASCRDRLVHDISSEHRSYISSCGRDRPVFDRL